MVFASKKTMTRLSEAQRSLLRDAMRASVPAALKAMQDQEREAMASLCRRGIEPADAGDADKAALRDAVAPVLDDLGRDPRTRAALESIAAMREQTDLQPALTCSAKKGVYPDRRRGLIIEGTFSVYRDRFVATGNNGDVVRARFTFDGTSLRFHDVKAVADLVVGFGSHPWKRAR